MSARYGAPDKKIDPIQPSNGVKITCNEVRLSQSCPDGWTAVIKKQPALVRHYIHYGVDACSLVHHCVLDFERRDQFATSL